MGHSIKAELGELVTEEIPRLEIGTGQELRPFLHHLNILLSLNINNKYWKNVIY